MRVANQAIRFKPAAGSELAALSTSAKGSSRGGPPGGGGGRRNITRHAAGLGLDEQQTRAGQLWIQSPDGEIKPVRVRFGIADDNYTQVMGSDIKEGDLVITRIRKASK